MGISAIWFGVKRGELVFDDMDLGVFVGLSPISTEVEIGSDTTKAEGDKPVWLRIGTGGIFSVGLPSPFPNKAFAFGADATLRKNRTAADDFFSGDPLPEDFAGVVAVVEEEGGGSLIRGVLAGVIGDGWVYVCRGEFAEAEKDEVELDPSLAEFELLVDLPNPLYLSFFDLDCWGTIRSGERSVDEEGLGVEKNRDLNAPRPNIEFVDGDLCGVDIPDPEEGIRLTDVLEGVP